MYVVGASWPDGERFEHTNQPGRSGFEATGEQGPELPLEYVYPLPWMRPSRRKISCAIGKFADRPAGKQSPSTRMVALGYRGEVPSRDACAH